MRVSGRTIKLTAKELTHMQMELSILASGLMTNKREMVSKSGLMVLNMKDNIFKVFLEDSIFQKVSFL